MAERMSGGWARRTQVDTAAPLKPPVDPEHIAPTATPEYQDMSPLWVNSAPAPLLPVEFEPQATPGLPTGLGPVDHTPVSHDYGVGVGPGLTVLESQDQMGLWHQDDQGAVAEHAWVAAVQRDGQPHLEVSYDQQLSGDSPQTLQLERSGIGQPNDPEATLRGPARRFKRWYDRYIDMHRYPTDRRPLTPKHAYMAPPQPAVPNGTQNDSPWPTSVTFRTNPQDRYVVPVMRRTPGSWDADATTDGTASALAGASTSYGLTSYGL
jgi:hypothetical protein